MRKSISPVENVNTPAIVTSAGEVLEDAGAGGRRGWSIQNVGTNPVFVCLGGTASSTVFHYVLKAGTGASDGLGGSVEEKMGAVFQGSITIAGTTPKVVVSEYE